MSIKTIFFSYSRSDASAFAQRLAVDLKKHGFDVWIDQEDIRAGSEWDLEIEKALETCDCLLFIETEKSVTSNNVLDEVYYALEQRKKVIPVIVVDSKTPFRLQRLQHINFTTNYHAGLSQLLIELQQDTTAATDHAAETTTPAIVAPHKKNYMWAIISLLVVAVIILAAIFFKKDKQPSTPVITNQTNIGTADNIPSPKDTMVVVPETQQPVQTQTSARPSAEGVKTQDHVGAKRPPGITRPAAGMSVEDYTGNWRLINVAPAAESSNGYLKVEAGENDKVTVKSYMQFYYPKINETSYTTVFNAFAGCAGCVLQKEMKLAAEDIAIGSRTIKTLQQDQPDGGKAGDVIMDASSNKSISGRARLQFVTNSTAVIKVERPTAVSLANELTLPPFVYTFRFKKSE